MGCIDEGEKRSIGKRKRKEIIRKMHACMCSRRETNGWVGAYFWRM